MIHQHFTLVPSLTVTENILLGLREPRFRLDLARIDAKVGELADADRPARRPTRQGLAALGR